MSKVTIGRLSGEGAKLAVPQLATVLMDCVDGGASVSFMAPLSRAKAEAFWARVADSVEHGATDLLVARDASGIVGTVQLQKAMPENQPHRADVAKLLVHRRARRQGIGRALMGELDRVAAAAGKTLLVLDTASDDAERLYHLLGWTVCGTIPNYALFPDGRPCKTVVFWKELVATA